jgi:hypothetical protein
MTPANKHMLRAGTHKVPGRGRSIPVPKSAPRARVLIGLRAGADVDRWATHTSASLKIGPEAAAFPAL